MWKELKPCCFFCDSALHNSESCDAYISDESRLNIIHSKNCCKNCLKPLPKGSSWCKACQLRYKCHICFSKLHNIFLCPLRDTALKWHFPKIDVNLLFRFIQILDPMEQYYLSTSTPTTNFVDNFQILRDLSVTIVSDENNYKLARNFNQYVFSDIVILKHAKIITVEIYKLLSSKTKFFECSNVFFTSLFTFARILADLSNIEEIKLINSGIEIPKDWIAILEKQKNKLKKITITLNNCNFNVKKLAQYLQTKNIQISLYFNLSMSYANTCNLLNTKLLPHFTPLSSEKYFGSSLLIKIAENSNDKFYSYFNRFQPNMG